MAGENRLSIRSIGACCLQNANSYSKKEETFVAPMPIGKMLMAAGAFIFVVGLLFTLGARMGLGQLPGDINTRRGNTSFYFPVITSIVLSIVLTIVLNIVLRLRR